MGSLVIYGGDESGRGGGGELKKEEDAMGRETIFISLYCQDLEKEPPKWW
jgi:hypothetical protein